MNASEARNIQKDRELNNISAKLSSIYAEIKETARASDKQYLDIDKHSGGSDWDHIMQVLEFKGYKIGKILTGGRRGGPCHWAVIW